MMTKQQILDATTQLDPQVWSDAYDDWITTTRERLEGRLEDEQVYPVTIYGRFLRIG